MAAREYLDRAGLQHVSGYVNAKLTVVSTMPSGTFDLRTVLYIGETTEDYIQGGIYLYDETESKWILISTADVDLTDYETSWTGTLAEWQALDEEEQAKYEIVNITDDFVPGTTDHVAKGYYYNGKFYEDGAFTKEMPGVVGFIYIDLPYDDLYVYDDSNSEFVLASGGGSDSIVWGYYYEGSFYEDSAHTTIITAEEGYLYVDLGSDSIYIYKSDVYVQISGSGNYTAGFGVDISDDEIKTTDFVGTAQEWANVSDKTIYDFVHITDDTSQVEEGAPGHSISDGTSEKTQREILEFEGFTVTDDSTNGKTKVAEIPYTAGDGVDITNKEISVSDDISRTWTGTKAAWDAIVDKSVYDGWIINITDDQAVGSYIEDAVTEGSLNAVTSGAVYDALQNIGPGKTLVPWAQASDSEVAAMLNAYYNDELTLTEIQSVWHVGDIRTITLGSIAANNVGESHRSQNVDIVILDFEHDNLTTAINGHTKALITVQLKDCLRDATVADDDGFNNTENGYMNDTGTNEGGWTDSKRRAWCNNYFYNAIPASMRTLIKPVNKLTSAGKTSATINTDSDKCFLVSEIEILGSVAMSKSGEGNQYSYFETESNMYKLPKWNSSSSSDGWWERSPRGTNATGFCIVDPSGIAYYSNASYAYGLAPAWCL